MKKLAVATLAAATLLGSAAAHAGTTSETFTASVNLTAGCKVTSLAQDLNFGTYTAFGSATTPAPTGTISLECTRNFATPAVDIDGTVVTTGGIINGVLAGLDYTVTAGAVFTGPGTGADGGDTYDIDLTGGMAAGQAGSCTTDTCSASNTHTLTLTY